MVHLGIDLGTTNSAAAVFDGEKLTLIRNAQGGTLTPSVVRLDARGVATVGAKARRALDTDPANTRAEFKRLMGTEGPLLFPASGQRRTPQELAAEVLRSLRSDVKDQLGFLPECAVIAVPALFELPQTAATAEAAKLAGFEKVEFLQEPVASALAAGWTADQGGGRWLVFDLGGGTFDASLLEESEGLLRVVGHDGDNFLGGRDIDHAIVDWALEELARTGGPRLSRQDPAAATALRRLKQAAEEAKIELGRATETALSLPALDGAYDVDLLLTRPVLDALVAPILDRSIAVCRRLLAAHQLEPAQLGRIVLVGGPTAMPIVRTRLAEALQAPFSERLDAMTLVAQGAAIYAATAGLDARPASQAPRPKARQLWLRYPAMSSDLTPHVVGRLGEGGGAAISTVRLTRSDGLWHSAPAELSPEGAFGLQVELLPRRPNTFSVEARGSDGAQVPCDPAQLTIVQGLTIADPPLSRTIGVALASDSVRVFVERGCPLPARRTFQLETVETIVPGGAPLRIPVVQGESQRAHLCRLVGALEIGGPELKAQLPVGSVIEVTLELDRGGRLSARALAPALGQVFSQVAQLVVPDATPQALRDGAKALLERATFLRKQAFSSGQAAALGPLAGVEERLAEVERGAAAAEGGDADAGQKARRTLLDVDGALEELEAAARWPQIEERISEKLGWAWSWSATFGTASERRVLDEAAEALQRARARKDAAEVERQLRLVESIGDAAYFRNPSAWSNLFQYYSSRADSASDLRKAQALVERGNAAVQRRDEAALKKIIDELAALLPPDERERRLGFGSGVR
jgi:molecular chaperone DnaK